MQQELLVLGANLVANLEDAHISEDGQVLEVAPPPDEDGRLQPNNDEPHEVARGWKKITPENMHMIKIADVLEIWHNGSPHTILVESISKKEDTVFATAFHYGWHRAIKTVKREEFKLSGRSYCRLQLFSQSCCYDPEVVLQRAQSRLNDQYYSRISSNSGQFARWCKKIDSTHLGTVPVPIYLSDGLPVHTVKKSDHIDLKFGLMTVIHGEVTAVREVGDTGHLLTVLVNAESWKKAKVPIINRSEEELKAEAVLKVAKSDLPESLHPRLRKLADLIKDLTFQRSVSSKIIAQIVVESIQVEDEERCLENFQAGKTSSRINFQKIRAPDLHPGDIICSGIFSTHRVILEVIPTAENGIKIKTIQYSVDETSHGDDHKEINYIIGKKETGAKLSVHNDRMENCPLYGGGSEKPDETRLKIVDPASLTVGSVVSFKKDTLIYVRAVLVSEPKIVSTSDATHKETDSLKEIELELVMYEYSSTQGAFPAYRIIKKCVKFNSTDELYQITYKVPAERKFAPEQVVARAMSRLREEQHDLQWNSTRDLARWCSIRHASNREQCCVPIESAEQLLEFGKGHIKFQRYARLYAHDAILREAHRVPGCEDIVRVRMYENNGPFRKVRIESLDFTETESIRRVRHPSSHAYPALEHLNELNGFTFLDSDDDFMGSVGKGGSKVRSEDFCYWVKRILARDGSQSVQSLFGSELSDIRRGCEQLEFEDGVAKSDLRMWDHIILKRKVHGKLADVHFVIASWDAVQCAGEAVTFEYGTAPEDKGIKDFRGFLKIATTNSCVEKVVHNYDLDWDKIDKRFSELIGLEAYSLSMNNCEHFVNFLFYGRRTSLQLMTRATQLVRIPSIVSRLVPHIFEILGLVSKLFVFKSRLAIAVPIVRYVAIFIHLLSSGIETFLLRQRQVRHGMPASEFRQRVLNAWLSPVPGTAIAFIQAIHSP